MAGEYYDSSGVVRGFTSYQGKYTTIDDPKGSGGTDIECLNNSGVVVGYHVNKTGAEIGMIFHPGT